MIRVRLLHAKLRGTLAVALLILLALRLLNPAGFMPSFEHGAVTIVACPDGGAALPGHNHDHSKAHAHQTCPYAAASALGGLANDLPLLAAILVIGLALLLGRPFLFIERHRSEDRPPLRGPPIPA